MRWTIVCLSSWSCVCGGGGGGGGGICCCYIVVVVDDDDVNVFGGVDGLLRVVMAGCPRGLSVY